MDTFAQNLNREGDHFMMIKPLFNILSTLNIHIDCIQPIINFGFISNLTQQDMILTVINDYGSILTFIKIVPQKDKKHVPKHTCFCIPKHYCSYYHYESGRIINDNIFEWVKLDPEFISSIVTFKYSGTEINISDIDPSEYSEISCYVGDDEIEPKISSLQIPEINNYLAYYIKRKQLDHVHCFMNQQEEYEQELDYEHLTEIIESNAESDVDEIALEICNYINTTQSGMNLIDFIGVYDDKSVKIKGESKKPQTINIHIATYISQNLINWIFKRN